MRRVGFFVWGLSVAIVVVLSVLPGPVAAEVAPPLSDKLGHGGAYFLLALMPGLLFDTTPRRAIAMAAMVALGCVLELVQTMAPGRGVEVLDALANGAGAVAGWSTAELVAFFLPD